MNKRIAVDWDGTCVPDEYPRKPGLFPSTAYALRYLLDAGYEVVVYTCRLGPRAHLTDELMPKEERKEEYRYIRSTLNKAGLKDVLIYNKKGKPGADYYVDDRAIHFNGDWDDVLDQVPGV